MYYLHPQCYWQQPHQHQPVMLCQRYLLWCVDITVTSFICQTESVLLSVTVVFTSLQHKERQQVGQEGEKTLGSARGSIPWRDGSS